MSAGKHGDPHVKYPILLSDIGHKLNESTKFSKISWKMFTENPFSGSGIM
jgi:hypothetical protein